MSQHIFSPGVGGQRNVDPSVLQQVLPPPVQVRHSEYSLLLSADDETAQPSDRLIALSIDAIDHARRISLSDISARMRTTPKFPDVWPGEHYKLLAGLVLALNPQIIVEIGTATGLSALTLRRFQARDGKLHTFDVVPWNQFPETALTPADFADGGIVQHVDDLANPLIVPLHYETIKNAELIFVDAAKDGQAETRLLQNLNSITFAKQPIVVFDDIRLWNMLSTWRNIKRPKLDLTSFGHWSGTGLVDWG